MPQNSPIHGDTKAVRCAMIVGEGHTVAVGFDHESESWTELHREPTPDDAFTGDFITNEDHDHPEIQRIMEAMEKWETSTGTSEDS